MFSTKSERLSESAIVEGTPDTIIARAIANVLHQFVIAARTPITGRHDLARAAATQGVTGRGGRRLRPPAISRQQRTGAGEKPV
ncbi:MAG TPA: hypothetical protein VHY79_09445 [Rhizomicrobium sp.]|jgi:hypothetical protein|nr:hypothetical protein [Rhizomicrobium sp.]